MKTGFKRLLSYILIFIIGLCISGNIDAETVSRKEAERYASDFFKIIKGETPGALKMVYNGRNLTTSRLFPPFYVFNHPKGGFVIISAENKAFPLLGYSFDHSFDASAVSGSLKSFLTRYAIDIENIRYDSRVPEQAISAWNNFESYVRNEVSGKLPESVFKQQSGELLDQFYLDINEDEYGRWFSDIYTPAQWKSMISVKLNSTPSVVLGIVESNDIVPVILSGHQSDYFRIVGNDFNAIGMFRLFSTEYLSGSQFCALENAPEIKSVVEEDIPFAFYDSYKTDLLTESRGLTEINTIEENLYEPIIRSIGGGRFEIQLPHEVEMTMIYNLAGNMVGSNRYGTTNVAHINLESNPVGFYIVQVIDRNGQTFGFKLYR